MPHAVRRLIFLLPAISLLSSATSSARSSRAPQFVTYHLAGAALSRHGDLVRHDVRSGYYLTRWYE
jgi:hypothetical protein